MNLFRYNNDSENPAEVHVTINGQAVKTRVGNTVAATVLAHGLRYTRTTPVSGEHRAPFCLMGVCYECLMIINGKANQRACATFVSEGMRIETQYATDKQHPPI